MHGTGLMQTAARNKTFLDINHEIIQRIACLIKRYESAKKKGNFDLKPLNFNIKHPIINATV